MTRLLFRLRTLARLSAARLRAHWAGAMGVRMGSKGLLGRGVRIDRPWTVELGPRCVLEPHVWFNVVSDDASLCVGERTFIGRGTELGVLERVRIGAHVLIGPGVFITDHQHGMELGRPMDEQPCAAAPVEIGDDVWLGARAVVLPGVRIGPGAVVGAAAVVTREVPANAIVAGAPARVLRMRGQQAEGETP